MNRSSYFNKIFFIILPILFCSCIQTSLKDTGRRLQLVNKHAKPETRRLYSYLQESSKECILSGQHNYPGTISRYTDEVYTLVGKKPIVWGQDFGFTYDDKDGIIFRDSIISEAIRKHKEGHIITLMWHAVRPIDKEPNGWKESVQNELTIEEWNALVTPGTPIYNHWLSQLDIIATYLKRLQAENVPVIWRPYHEMNGSWFWWGGKTGKRGYKLLYRNMYDYFTNYHKLNNLIWVWNANEISSPEIGSYNDYFPGLDVVDILATDVYSGKYSIDEYKQLKQLSGGKPIAIGECGALPSPEILAEQPDWCWFMCWAGFLQKSNSKEQISRVYNHKKVHSLND